MKKKEKTREIKMKEKKVSYYLLKGIYKPLLFILYRPKVYGKENIPKEGRLILAGNHRNAIDPVIAMSNTKRIVHFMAKEALFKGISGMFLKGAGIIKVSKDRNKNVSSVMGAEKILNNGGTIGIFPEGTRNRTSDDLLKFRTGTVIMAKNTNSLIVPFAISGKYRIFINDLKIRFGKPIDVSNMDTNEANDILRNEVLKLYKEV